MKLGESVFENKYTNVSSIDDDLHKIKDSDEQGKRDVMTKIFCAGCDFHADPGIIVKK